MQKKISIRLLPEQINNESNIRDAIAQKEKLSAQDITGYHLLKRSLDARSKTIRYQLSLLVFIREPFIPPAAPQFHFPDVSKASKSVIVVGCGPAGMFAALHLIRSGIRPVLLERGKDVRSRRRDLAALNKQGIVDPNSNYCFGEGGAGTYSDGKLYTRSNKRGNLNGILNLFVHFGASPEIITDAHPHIGTNKLPQIITAMRNQILQSGGEVLFGHRVEDFIMQQNRLKGVVAAGKTFLADAVLLATGHSARDVFELLHRHGLALMPKPFALGVRVEHPQELINRAQYHRKVTDDLPPAAYALVKQVQHRGMFSFCMCPGGIIAPAVSAPGEIVVNGWSPSKRNNPFANSGIVVEITEKDAAGFVTTDAPNDPFLFLRFQQMVEKAAFAAGGGGCVAPAQRLVDFCTGKISSDLPDNSYLPGLQSADLGSVLPSFVYRTLQEGFPHFGKLLRGYYTNDAVVVATESRTSSPVKIPRDAEKLHHPQLQNLYPCGEGAGYAGGIVSAAMDGERVAEAIAKAIK